MHRIYRLLPKDVATKLRNVLEYQGGVSAGSNFPASYRRPVGAQRPPVIPSSEPKHDYNISYLGRDPRNVSRDALTLEESIRIMPSADPVKLIEEYRKTGKVPEHPLIATPTLTGDRGSAGRPNKDVARYSPDGLRSAMTATWDGMEKSLLSYEATHLPRPSWAKTVDVDAVLSDMKSKGLAMPDGVGLGQTSKQYAMKKWNYYARV